MSGERWTYLYWAADVHFGMRGRCGGVLRNIAGCGCRPGRGLPASATWQTEQTPYHYAHQVSIWRPSRGETRSSGDRSIPRKTVLSQQRRPFREITPCLRQSLVSLGQEEYIVRVQTLKLNCATWQVWPIRPIHHRYTKSESPCSLGGINIPEER